jgi:FlaA1/EpsC-like NDP-sugar epimerase
MKYLIHKRRITLIAIDIGIIAATYAFVILLRLFANLYRPQDLGTYALNMAILTATVMLSRLVFRIYKNVWRYANSRVYLEMTMCDIVGGFVGFAISYAVGSSVTSAAGRALRWLLCFIP